MTLRRRELSEAEVLLGTLLSTSARCFSTYASICRQMSSRPRHSAGCWSLMPKGVEA